jgi:hypothetical protein
VELEALLPEESPVAGTPLPEHSNSSSSQTRSEQRAAITAAAPIIELPIVMYTEEELRGSGVCDVVILAR